ncbi:cupin domain-containing protein [Amorphoplanes digitatis]|uniref:Quercetin dioxygenase-like cupin family protein n=1 Tax=Actinoplanes digitatis TaxID=1868 RepID=A0A7W7MNZ5_9ACTN|nr:cupin domain-containing protein [Actinoplanes digitatis]MBB4761045.1 quercetin dioxygenase-like cupin family protein [Actinoplanes digitatis]GID92661.1 cupin [Actinoplanes digitatis]
MVKLLDYFVKQLDYLPEGIDMPVVREHDAVAHQLHGATFNSFVAPSSGSTELCAWRLEVAAGTTGVPHRVSREEVLLIMSGEVTVSIDGVVSALRPGEVAFVPAGAMFGLDNASGVPATAWVTTSVGLEATLPDGSSISPPWVR